MRAVPIPEGRHRVELRYESSLLAGSLMLSVASTLLLLGAAGLGLKRRRGVGKPLTVPGAE